MITLDTMVGLCKARKRRGRGGDRGGTSGRGGQGQGSRSGGANRRRGFEGGQMPLVRRLPKRGFTNAQFRVEYAVVNLDRLEAIFAAGSEVSSKTLLEYGVLRDARMPVKILGTGTLTKQLTVYADACSASARAAIEKVGGSVNLP